MLDPVKIILVPVDGSENSNAAATYAADLAQRLQVPVRLLFAFAKEPIDIIDVPYEGANRQALQALQMSIQNFEKLREESAMRVFAAARERIPAGVQVDERTLAGHAGEALVKHAENEPGALLVMGRRSRSRLGEMFVLGSVSRYVVHHAPCPVLVAR
jgi:nucleotide-binding universal stress UspA family protein